MANILTDFGINLLEEEVDDVIFQTNEFLCDATFTGSQGPFWWLSLNQLILAIYYSVNQLLINSCLVAEFSNGTKMGQNWVETYISICFHQVHVFKDLCLSFAKVQTFCETNEGKPLNLSVTAEFLDILCQQWHLRITKICHLCLFPLLYHPRQCIG